MEGPLRLHVGVMEEIEALIEALTCPRPGRQAQCFRSRPFSVRHSCAAAKVGAGLSKPVSVVDVTAKSVSSLDVILVATDHVLRP